MRARTATPRKPPIKAPSPVLRRCQIGENLSKARAHAVQAASVDDWYTIDGKFWMRYCKHVAKCVQCKAYHDQKRIEQDKRFDAKKV